MKEVGERRQAQTRYDVDSMSAIQIEPRKCTITHLLARISWQHVSNSNGTQETQQLTLWIGFHCSMLAIQMEPRR